MSSVADWTPLPSPPPRGSWFARFRKLSPWDWAGAAAISGLLIALYLWRVSSGALPPTNLVLAVPCCLMQGLAFLSLRSAARTEQALERQVGEYPAGKFLAVRMEILRDGLPIGGDLGTVIFGAGMLMYSGARTEFRLGRADVAEPPEGWGAGLLLAANPRVRVRFTRVRRKGYGSIDEALLVWLLNPPEARGETVLPPLEPMPGYVPPRRLAAKRPRDTANG